MVDTPRTQADLLTTLFHDGQAASSITEQDMRDFIVSQSMRGGWKDYNDAATASTPISVTGGAGFVDLTNDGLGAFTNSNFINPGITDVWDTTAQLFDFTELSIGDVVDIRMDVTVTTTAVNQQFQIVLELGTGGTPYDIPFVDTQKKTAAAYQVNRFNGIYMGDANTQGSGGKFKIKSDGNCSVVVNGWWCHVIKV